MNEETVFSQLFGVDFFGEKKLISTIVAFAWIDLIVGLIGALVIWSQFSESQGYVAISFGFASALQGIFVWALLLVIAGMARNLIAIRENTSP